MLTLLLACFVTQADWDKQSDRDEDGFIDEEIGGLDCDDGNSQIHPNAVESCLDDIDSDCDGHKCPPTSERQPEPWATGEYLWEPLLGDFDGDGADEIVFSELRANPQDEYLTMQLELPLGATFDPPSDPEGVVVTSAELLGAWAFDAGDLDGDGDPDVALSSRGGQATTAMVDSLPRMPLALEDLPSAWIVSNSSANDPVADVGGPVYYGRVQPMGDPDGNGLDAVLLSAPTVSDTDALNGAVYLLEGFPRGQQDAFESAVAVFVGQPSELLGFHVGSGDLDDDGFQDPILSGPGWGPGAGAGAGAHGQIAIFTSRSPGTKTSADADAWIRGDYANSRVGSGYGIGDVDGDGTEDMACYLGSGNGQVLIYWGPLEGEYSPVDAPLRLTGDDSVTHDFGKRVRRAGDLDGDGFDEILVSAPTEGLGDDMALNGGAMYLFYGPLVGVAAPEHAAVRWEGQESQANLGTALLADFDGDGETDALFGTEPLFGQSAGTLWLDTDVLADVYR